MKIRHLTHLRHLAHKSSTNVARYWFATRCNTLQHSAPHCSIAMRAPGLQHTARHCNTLHRISSRQFVIPACRYMNSSRQFVIFIYRIHLVNSWYSSIEFISSIRDTGMPALRDRAVYCKSGNIAHDLIERFIARYLIEAYIAHHVIWCHVRIRCTYSTKHILYQVCARIIYVMCTYISHHMISGNIAHDLIPSTLCSLSSYIALSWSRQSWPLTWQDFVASPTWQSPVHENGVLCTKVSQWGKPLYIQRFAKNIPRFRRAGRPFTSVET